MQQYDTDMGQIWQITSVPRERTRKRGTDGDTPHSITIHAPRYHIGMRAYHVEPRLVILSRASNAQGVPRPPNWSRVENML